MSFWEFKVACAEAKTTFSFRGAGVEKGEGRGT